MHARSLPLLLVLALVATDGHAQDAGVDAGATIAPAPAPEDTSSGPLHVVTGVYLNQIISIDLKMNQFTADFWMWFRWRGGPSDYNPLDSFDIINARINSRATTERRTLPDGTEYAEIRLNATITRQWELERYPFDDHELQIAIEDATLEDHRLVFDPDVDNSDVDPDLSVSGWRIGEHHMTVATRVYHSNYGDTSLPTGSESSYSRVLFTVDLHREGLARFFKVFFGIFVATLVSWAAFLFRPKDAGSRVGVSIGALFAAAASSIAINAQLPEVNGITLADTIVFICLTAILIGLVLSIVSLRLADATDALLAHRVNRIATIAFPLAVIGAILLAVHG